MLVKSRRRDFIKHVYDNVAIQQKSSPTDCDTCFDKYDFIRLENLSKKTCLPPVGSFEERQVLFVGTNPRCNRDKGDDLFYRHALSSFDSFLQFSKDGKYEDSLGHTRFLFDFDHYNLHQKCLARIDPSWKLGDKSSVAELFMCGSKDSNIFYTGHNLYKKYNPTLYVCAQKYLIKYIELVKPKIIVSFGWPTMQWFQIRFWKELEKNTWFLDNETPRKYNGCPTKDGIRKLHGHFAEISLEGGHVLTLIFSLHPNARNFDFDRQEELLELFLFVAKNLGKRMSELTPKTERIKVNRKKLI